MSINIRPFVRDDVKYMIEIWNEIVEAGDAFPQKDYLDEKNGYTFFASQTLTAVAEKDNEIVGLYILHPNNIGRCGHIANSSYAVKQGCRGEKIGEKLVVHSLRAAKENGFRILQFNAVVVTNTAALKLYKKLGFSQLGVIPGGFHIKNDEYLDIIPHYIKLV
jgi:ribosomal protein S18 acetylase RimI-like enzyme